ncbi:MAG: radical SAM protein [Nanoarchaeota archaeon]
MKVCLINPSIREEALPTYVPSGLGYLAHYLEKDGHTCDIFDINALRLSDQEIKMKFKEMSSYDVFGITGLITNYLQMKQYSSLLKNLYPDKPIVVGGPVTTGLCKVFIERTKADIAVEGEGELIFVDLINALSHNMPLEYVPGLTIRDSKGKPFFTGPGKILDSLDELPPMPWHKFHMDIYLKNNIITGYTFKNSINIMGSRGCPYRCNFCFDGAANRKLRFRSAKMCLRDIKLAHKKFTIDYFRWDDELFVANVQRAKDFCTGMVSSGLNRKIKWGCTGRVNIVTPELLKLMRKAGCIDINYGIESGSNRMLKNMNKVTTREMGLRAIKWTKEAGITPFTSFMVGTRDEDEESIWETVTFLKEADLLIPELFFTTPNPGTELWEYCVKAGQIKDQEKFIIEMCKMGDFSKRPLVNITALPTEKFIALKKKAQKQILINYLVNNKFRIPQLAYQRYKRVGFKRFLGLCKNAIERLTATTGA